MPNPQKSKSLLPSTNTKLPAGIWVLGFVSLLMDLSSEMIHSLLHLFMTGTLGASAAIVGLIEGLAESTALMVEVFSGVSGKLYAHAASTCYMFDAPF